MSKLKEILNGMQREEIEAAAEAAGTTPEYLTEQLANGHRKAGIPLARRLVKALKGRAKLSDIRPDIYEQEQSA